MSNLWLDDDTGLSLLDDLLAEIDEYDLPNEKSSAKSHKLAKKVWQGNVDGMICKECHFFFAYAESNQEDGSLICYSCRHNL